MITLCRPTIGITTTINIEDIMVKEDPMVEAYLSVKVDTIITWVKETNVGFSTKTII